VLVSLTLTPMMAARLLRPHGRARHGRLYRASERAFEALQGRATAAPWTPRCGTGG
jgi:multidrug efflux pump subunit AcrB